MKYLLTLIIFANISLANAQPDIFNSTNNTSTVGTLEAYDQSGKRIPIGSSSIVEGSKMLNDRFEKGIVKFRSGQQYTDVLLNLSLVTNELYFKKDSMQLMFANPVEQFTLPVNDNGKEKTFFFKSGYPYTGKQTNTSFYQLLTGGPKFEFLKYEYKTASERYTYGGPVKNEYETRCQLYIYDVINDKIFEISNNIKSLKKSLPAYETIIDNFASQNKTKFKQEDEIKLLIDFINKQI